MYTNFPNVNACSRREGLPSSNLAICFVTVIRELVAHRDIISRCGDKGSCNLTNVDDSRDFTFLLFAPFYFSSAFAFFFPFLLFAFFSVFACFVHVTRFLSREHVITAMQLVRSITSRYYQLQLQRRCYRSHASRDIHLHFGRESFPWRRNNDSLFQTTIVSVGRGSCRS